jgi:hypothetical protein
MTPAHQGSYGTCIAGAPGAGGAGCYWEVNREVRQESCSVMTAPQPEGPPPRPVGLHAMRRYSLRPGAGNPGTRLPGTLVASPVHTSASPAGRSQGTSGPTASPGPRQSPRSETAPRSSQCPGGRQWGVAGAPSRRDRQGRQDHQGHQDRHGHHDRQETANVLQRAVVAPESEGAP